MQIWKKSDGNLTLRRPGVHQLFHPERCQLFQSDLYKLFQPESHQLFQHLERYQQPERCQLFQRALLHRQMRNFLNGSID